MQNLTSTQLNQSTLEGSVKGIGDLMKQAQQVSQQMQQAQEELAKVEITGESGAGLVKIVINGKHEARRVEIDPDLFSGNSVEERQVLEDLIAAAFNNAVHRLEAEHKDKMGGLAAGFGIPSDFKLPF